MKFSMASSILLWATYISSKDPIELEILSSSAILPSPFKQTFKYWFAFPNLLISTGSSLLKFSRLTT